MSCRTDVVVLRPTAPYSVAVSLARFARCRDGYESPLGVTRSRTRAFACAPREPDDRTEPSGNVQHVQIALGVAGGYFLAARGR